MIDREQLRQAYLRTRSNKRRSADAMAYEMHQEMYLEGLHARIANRSLAPAAYTFITMRPRPREIFACDMDMRIVHHYLDMRMRPLIERRLTDRTFNNRIGMGTDAAVNQLISDVCEVSHGYTRDAWVISIDLLGYFPNASQDTAYAQLSSLIAEDYQGDDKDDMQYLLRSAIYAYPTKHCYRKSPLWMWKRYIPDDKSLFRKPDGIGAAIGHLLWQNGMNYYLNDLDHWILDNVCAHYLRFVDDMYFVVENKDAFLPWLQVIREKLAAYGCRMHPRKFRCQHYGKGVNILGSTVKPGRVYPSRRIVRNAFRVVADFNRRPRPGRLEAFIASLNSYLGYFKRRNAYGLTQRLIGNISPEWWKYCHYDDTRRALKANPGYTHYELIAKTYHFKINRHDYPRTNQRTAIKAA